MLAQKVVWPHSCLFILLFGCLESEFLLPRSLGRLCTLRLWFTFVFPRARGLGLRATRKAEMREDGTWPESWLCPSLPPHLRLALHQDTPPSRHSSHYCFNSGSPKLSRSLGRSCQGLLHGCLAPEASLLLLQLFTLKEESLLVLFLPIFTVSFSA
jgi:hypothetical protein